MPEGVAQRTLQKHGGLLGVAVGAANGLVDDFVHQPKCLEAQGRDTQGVGSFLCFVGGFPQNRCAAFGADNRVNRVLEHHHLVGHRDGQCAARTALADDGGDDGHLELRHFKNITPDGLRLAALFGINARVGARRIDEGKHWQLELFRQLHQAQGFAVALRLAHAEVAQPALFGIPTFLLAQHHAWRPIEPSQAAHDAQVIGEVPVAIAYISELAKAKSRGRFVLLFEMVFPVGLFTAALLYLALRWLVVRPLQVISGDMIAFRRSPEGPSKERPPSGRNDEIGVVDREFQNLQRELRASLRQKTRLAEVGAASNKINHDLRNMLSTARLLSDRLARSDDERTRALAPTILNTIDRAARLASDALEYVRDHPTPRMEEFDLSDLVDEVGVALQEAGEDRDPNLLRDWRDEIAGECRVTADRDLLYRVLVNLGRNAFDAGATEVAVRARQRSGLMLIDVIDNGPGVPAVVASQLFRPFTTGGRSSGTGLGLAIARDLVRAHGGDIALMETSDRGSTFRFTLPL